MHVKVMKRSAFPNLRTIAMPSWYSCCKLRGPPGKLEPSMMRRPSNQRHQHQTTNIKFKKKIQESQEIQKQKNPFCKKKNPKQIIIEFIPQNMIITKVKKS
jgi:hypothetical protein